MFTFILERTINAPADVVWETINNVDDYPNWNPFVKECKTDLTVGSPIVMKVKLGPIHIKQKETIFECEPKELLNYGVNIPFILNSSRKHIIKAQEDDTTYYQSFFQLRSTVSSLVGLLMGSLLKEGFTSMTDALVKQAEANHQQNA